VTDQEVKPWQAIPCRILSALGAPSVKQRRISQNLCRVTSDLPQRDRVGWPSFMLLVFPEALSGWTSQAKCCEQLYYEQPYCICGVAPSRAPYPCSLTPLQPYSQQQKETLFPKSFDRNRPWLLLPEHVIMNFIDGELLPFNIGLTTWQSQR